MAAITHGIVQQLADQSDGTGGWVTALQDPLANYVAGGTYLIVVTAQVTGDSVADEFDFQVLHAATTFEGSQMAIYPKNATIATHRKSYSFMVVFDQPGGGAEDINFQFRTVNAAQNVYADSIQIFRMRLDSSLVEGADYRFAEDDDSGAPTAHTNAFADFASITFTPANAGDEWLIIGCYNYEVDNLNVSAEYRINRDSDTEVAPLTVKMGRNIAEQRMGLLIRPFQLTKVAHTFKMQGRDDGVDGAQNDHYYTSIIAIRMNAFADFEYSWDESEFTFASADTWEEIAALDFTPSAGADFLVFAACAGDAGVGGRHHSARIQDGGVTDPVGQDVYDCMEQSEDADDERMVVQMAMPTLAAALEDLDMDGRAGNTGLVVEDITFVALSMELAGAPAGPAGGFGAGASAIGM